MKPACKDCFWWVAQIVEVPCNEPKAVRFEYPFGYCHLRPPISGSNPWPKTLAQDYCARFRSKEDVDNSD